MNFVMQTNWNPHGGRAGRKNVPKGTFFWVHPGHHSKNFKVDLKDFAFLSNYVPEVINDAALDNIVSAITESKTKVAAVTNYAEAKRDPTKRVCYARLTNYFDCEVLFLGGNGNYNSHVCVVSDENEF